MVWPTLGSRTAKEKERLSRTTRHRVIKPEKSPGFFGQLCRLAVHVRHVCPPHVF